MAEELASVPALELTLEEALAAADESQLLSTVPAEAAVLAAAAAGAGNDISNVCELHFTLHSKAISRDGGETVTRRVEHAPQTGVEAWCCEVDVARRDEFWREAGEKRRQKNAEKSSPALPVRHGNKRRNLKP